MVGAAVILTDRFIFIHVPKSAGMSVTQALGGRTPGLDLHAPMRCIDKGDRFAFGFIRNPWARMVSLYRFLCQKQFRSTDNFDQDKVRRIGFSAWLTEDEFFMQQDHLPSGHPFVMRDKWTGDGGDLPPMQRRPQMWWLEGCDFIGRVDNLQADLDEACKRAGLEPRTVPRANTTTGGDYRLEYGDREAEFVAEWFAPDIARFGYGF